ncbi:granulin a isoform X1 [Maylandia zebra]|uniref:granulin a isoform X1 n=1 Tax=Maylandia zebra TaxID=106582 RepID=UPI00403CC7D2
MQKWVVICWAALAVVGADVCPDGGLCKEGETCCNSPANGYGCCRYENAECCDDHIHCCPEGTVCNKALSGCINTTLTIPWVKRTPADQPKVSKSFRMIKTYESQEDDNICPDLSRCPAEYSCLKGLTKFGCCPLTQGISCPDGKHCCPEGHDCSSDSRGCIKKELVVTVLCSDGISECPDGTTCCETNDGKWACCPLSKAVCCADKIHCCSEGTTCDVEHSKCIDSSTKKEMPMWAKLPARVRAAWENQKEEVPVEAVNNTGTENAPKVTTANLLPPSANDVPCDDTSACPDGTTCCKTQEGGWACCPMPEAVCCEDFIHCCPKGKKCNLEAQTCEDGLMSVPWAKKVPAIIKQKVEVKDVPCDDTSACPDGTTCCKTQEGGWACCPMPEAVCCEDFIHCCPKGKKCNLEAQTCEGGVISVPWAKKVPAIIKQKVEVKDVPCDDTSACPDGTTCCKTQEGGWACCPMPEAVCCEDFIHCCPKGKKCNLKAQTCEDGLISVPWAKKLPAIIKQKVEVKDVPCDDTSACPDGTTCCKTQEGGWACCPMPEAVCCEDFIHCCPKGKKCNLKAQTCEDGLMSVPWAKKLPAIIKQKVEVKDVPCDDTSACPDGTTCCKTQEGGWACCPMPEAVCCEDFIHCCPKGKKCNLEAQTCEGGVISVPWAKKVPAIIKQKVEVKDVPCDDTSACPDGTTCCKTQEGGWACCPMPEAVCCEDFIHCCPKGKKCNLKAQTCEDGLISVPWAKKVPAIIKQKVEVKDVPCDDTSACPDGTTCCKTQEGGWACCPMPEAVCCEDFIHCCPKGKKCNLKAQTCEDGLMSVPWAKKLPAIIKQKVEVKDVPCDDTSACPDGTTCCKTQEGGWACCPMPEAVCCDDFIHCCPKGKKCNLEAQTCEDGLMSVPWAKKVPAIIKQKVEVKDVPCDDTSACPDGTTCCKTKEGGWACCPMPEAVCCDDFIHCCPKGKKCNLEAQTCEDGVISVPWAKKVPAIIKQKVEVKDVPCDDTSACPDGTTCCKTQEGGWACCPLPEAVCCEDFIHCCPKGKKCNLEAQTCEDGLMSVPWAKKVPAIIKQKVEVKDVPCDDTSACPDGTTCCKTQEGGWACCPMPEAVCCEDFIHCCPKGKKCNLEAQTCEDGVISVPWAKKLPAIIKQKVEEKKVPCDHTAACPDGTTCCKTQEGRWACCPLPEAVCCDDHKHCCPSGTTCDPTAVSCNGPSGSTPMLQKVPAFTTEAPTTVQPTTESPTTSAKSEEEDKEEEGMINCDAHTSCPQSTTCCYMKNFKKWGCCPLPEAVCCEDGSHCCPNQYKCDNSRTSCIKGEVVIPWYTKIPAITSDEAEPYSVQCEGASQCPEQTSCCKLFTGEWGCCPLKNAVCCPDKEHCCPQGYTCDILSRSCQKLIMMQLERVPLTPVYLLEPQPQLSPTKHKDIKCDEQTNCGHDETCCRTSATSWGCCPSSNAVCCSDMKHCCPTGYTCTEENSCIQNSKLYWPNWHVFLANKKRALIV